ncbi:MAG: hypothetical protein LBI62_01760 [Candidatus Accumulibacter sp.]|nr:hypothetical protein [Accumulibacter sp.]
MSGGGFSGRGVIGAPGLFSFLEFARRVSFCILGRSSGSFFVVERARAVHLRDVFSLLDFPVGLIRAGRSFSFFGSGLFFRFCRPAFRVGGICRCSTPSTFLK